MDFIYRDVSRFEDFLFYSYSFEKTRKINIFFSFPASYKYFKEKAERLGVKEAEDADSDTSEEF